jgi:hypothetical protein
MSRFAGTTGHPVGETKTNLCVGMDHGKVVTKLEKKARPSTRKGKLNKRVGFVREVISEVAGFSPYEKRCMELLKVRSRTPLCVPVATAVAPRAPLLLAPSSSRVLTLSPFVRDRSGSGRAGAARAEAAEGEAGHAQACQDQARENFRRAAQAAHEVSARAGGHTAAHTPHQHHHRARFFLFARVDLSAPLRIRVAVCKQWECRAARSGARAHLPSCRPSGRGWPLASRGAPRVCSFAQR